MIRFWDFIAHSAPPLLSWVVRPQEGAEMWREMSVQTLSQHTFTTIAVMVVAYFSVGWVGAVGFGVAMLVVALIGSSGWWLASTLSTRRSANRLSPWLIVAARCEPLLPLSFGLGATAFLLGGFWAVLLGGLAVATSIALIEPVIRHLFRSPDYVQRRAEPSAAPDGGEVP